MEEHGTPAATGYTTATGTQAQQRQYAGAQGEHATAQLLRQLAGTDTHTHVFHSVNLDDKRLTADIDHVIIRGDRILILDSKWWAPGRYRTTRDGQHHRPDGTAITPPTWRTPTVAAQLLGHPEGPHPAAALVIWNSQPGQRQSLRRLHPPDTDPPLAILQGSTRRARRHITRALGLNDPRPAPPNHALINRLHHAATTTAH